MTTRRRLGLLVVVVVVAAAVILGASATKSRHHDVATSTNEADTAFNPDLLWRRQGGRIEFLLSPSEHDPFAPQAIARLAQVAQSYGDMPVTVVPSTDPGFVTFKADRQRSECPSETLNPSASYVVVTPVFMSSKRYGWSQTFPVAQPCAIQHVYAIALNLRAIENDHVLGLTAARLQARGLVHEYGHLLGLCLHSDHWELASDGVTRHCRNASCALSGPTTTAKLYAAFRTGLFGRNVEDYCAECKRDIARTKAIWTRQHPVGPPGGSEARTAGEAPERMRGGD